MAKKRVFDNFDPHNNVVENTNLAYSVQNFTKKLKWYGFSKKCIFH